MLRRGSGLNLVRIVRRYIWVAPMVLGFLITLAGVYLLTEARSAKQEVLDALISENIMTPADATIPNVWVTDAETARVEMDWLETAYLEVTGGKRYAELDLDDPNREFAFELVQLRTSLDKPEVEHVTVVELSKDVIALVAGHYKARYGDRLTVVHADALDWKPPKGARYDAVWHDIWPDICGDNWETMKRLHRKYGRRCDWQNSWCRYQVKEAARI